MVIYKCFLYVLLASSVLYGMNVLDMLEIYHSIYLIGGGSTM